jgi:stress-induced morphogen
MSNADKAAMTDATAKCRAQVKEQAQYHDMSLYTRHKAVKKCVKDMLAGH